MWMFALFQTEAPKHCPAVRDVWGQTQGVPDYGIVSIHFFACVFRSQHVSFSDADTRVLQLLNYVFLGRFLRVCPPEGERLGAVF